MRSTGLLSAGRVLLACALLAGAAACARANDVVAEPDPNGGGGGSGGSGLFECAPGTGTCQDGQATLCREDGHGVDEFECDPVQGMVCEPDGCKGACSPASLGKSYIGCEYYPTVTLNAVWSGFAFAVAIANASDAPAHVTVTRGGEAVADQVIPAGSLQVLPLPWVPELKGQDWSEANGFTPPPPDPTRVVPAGAYRLRTDQPVTVYQFSALEYEFDPPPEGCPLRMGVCASYSNDASLLLPRNTLTRDYLALSWGSHGTNPGFVTVTATQDNTSVELVGATGAVIAGDGMAGDASGAVTLDAGDVLEVVAALPDDGNPFDPPAYGPDLSGTLVRSSRPVQVIAGHVCANVPGPTSGFCDHLEESMFPIETLGTDYLITAPRTPTGSPAGDAWPLIVRIAAVTEPTKLTFDPPILGEVTLLPGKPLEIPDVTEDVHVVADRPVAIAQYSVGQATVAAYEDDRGDPDQSLVVPTPQFRSSYVFLAPITYAESWVNVVAPAGAQVTLDGELLDASSFEHIGASGFAVARQRLADTEVHRVDSDVPVGIVTYGYGDWTSYMYPGGLDLAEINLPPPR